MSDDSKTPKDVITIEEVSALLGPPRRTIYQLAYEDPDFPKPFKPGRRLFWVRDEILAYRAKKQAEFAEKHKPHDAAPKSKAQLADERAIRLAWRRMQKDKTR